MSFRVDGQGATIAEAIEQIGTSLDEGTELRVGQTLHMTAVLERDTDGRVSIVATVMELPEK